MLRRRRGRRNTDGDIPGTMPGMFSFQPRYRFSRAWSLPAERRAIHAALLDTSSWPSWWPQLSTVVTVAGTHDDPHRLQRFLLRAPSGYTVTVDGRFTAIGDDHLRARLSGDLTGEGEIWLDEDGAGCRLRYDLEVATTHLWMRLLTPLARPLFAWNHDRLVAHGMAGLVRSARR